MKKWNNSNMIGYVIDDLVTEDELDVVIADINPLTEEEMDELFPIE